MRNLLLGTTLLSALAVSAAAQDDSINWLGSYREARQQAKATGKPIFVEFRCEA